MGAELRRWFARLLLLAWLAGTALIVWLMLIYPSTRAAKASRDFTIELEGPPSLDALTQRLVEEKVITRPRAFKAYLRLIGAHRRLRSGYLAVNRGLSVRDLLPRIATGFGASKVNVLIPEGLTRFDIMTRLARFGVAPREALLRATEDPELLARFGIPGDSFEGYLFPAVYDFLQGSKPEAVIARMVRVFKERTRSTFAAYAQASAANPAALSPHELLTLASIVEREARVADERPVIAGVFMNRLTDPAFKPKRLQADPTVAYGCLVARDRVPSCLEFDGRRITPAMVRDPLNPYSTYRREGLPPGPICNPGLSAVQAAANPERHNYFYFVTKGGGRHAFSASLDEHNANVRASP